MLPQGQAWPRGLDTTLVRTVRGLCEYWGFVDGRAGDLLERESDPRITLELLPDWERAWGLPDPCFPDATSISERQKMLMLKYTLLGGQSRAWFEWVAKWIGFPIKFREHAPFMVGVSRCGKTLDQDGFPRWQLGPPENRFYWSVQPGTARVTWFRCAGS